jgi:PadR family transcriptional regulator, regulatory protein PadR
LRSGGELDLPSGTIYPALHRLERTGLIASDWSTQGGRRRRTYRLTRAGHRALAAHREGWSRFTTVVERILAVPS